MYIYIYMCSVAILAQGCDLGVAACQKPQPFCLKCIGLCLAAHSSCIFMNSWVQSAVAKPANPGQAKNLTRTQLRRQQRKHTQQSYMLMKSKLISLVRPLPPTALIAEQLEAFRATLYIFASEEKAMQDTLEDTALVPITCNWCGTWMPMPR